MGFPGGASDKESSCQCRRYKRCGFHPWVGKIPWRRARQPSPVLLPRESHGQRSLVGYSPQGHRESDLTEVTEHTHKIIYASLLQEMATHSSILAWKIPWTEKPGRLQPMESQRGGHDWATSLHFTPLECDFFPFQFLDPWWPNSVSQEGKKKVRFPDFPCCQTRKKQTCICHQEFFLPILYNFLMTYYKLFPFHMNGSSD